MARLKVVNCEWCNKRIELDHPAVQDEYGEWMHIGCAVEEGDSQIIDSEHG